MTKPKNDGGPAFPSVCMNDSGHPASTPGMNLRDYFAGQAVFGLLACGACDETGADSVAQEAYALADAMLKEREGADNG